MDAQGNGSETGDRDPTTGQFLVGHRPIPGPGRPRSIATLIDELCVGKNPAEVIRFHFELMRGADAVTTKIMSGRKVGSAGLALLAAGSHAAKVLLEQRFGKPRQPITGPDGDGPVQVEALGLLEYLQKLAEGLPHG